MILALHDDALRVVGEDRRRCDQDREDHQNADDVGFRLRAQPQSLENSPWNSRVSEDCALKKRRSARKKDAFLHAKTIARGSLRRRRLFGARPSRPG